MNASYFDLVARSVVRPEPVGIEPPPLNRAMFPHQRHSTEFALHQGRAALFLETGLGKSLGALDWGHVLAGHARLSGKEHPLHSHCFGADVPFYGPVSDNQPLRASGLRPPIRCR